MCPTSRQGGSPSCRLEKKGGWSRNSIRLAYSDLKPLATGGQSMAVRREPSMAFRMGGAPKTEARAARRRILRQRTSSDGY
jgi:hypothetical protein